MSTSTTIIACMCLGLTRSCSTLLTRIRLIRSMSTRWLPPTVGTFTWPKWRWVNTSMLDNSANASLTSTEKDFIAGRDPHELPDGSAWFTHRRKKYAHKPRVNIHENFEHQPYLRIWHQKLMTIPPLKPCLKICDTPPHFNMLSNLNIKSVDKNDRSSVYLFNSYVYIACFLIY